MCDILVLQKRCDCEEEGKAEIPAGGSQCISSKREAQETYFSLSTNSFSSDFSVVTLSPVELVLCELPLLKNVKGVEKFCDIDPG